MSWQSKPKIDPREQGGITVLHVEGDLIFDLPSEWRQSIIDSFDAQREHARVVIDLADLNRLASWGEKRIKSFVNAVLGHDGRVAVLIDPNRSAMYAGLRVELARFDPPVPIVGVLDDALASLGGPQ